MRMDDEGNSCPETLGEYRDLCKALGGANCKAVAFLDEKITRDGRDEVVIAADSQMRMLLLPMILEKMSTED